MPINNSHWYAIFVATNSEETIKLQLEKELGDKFKYVIPKRILKERKNGKWHMIRRKLFPGYILVNGIITIEDYYKFRSISGIIKLLGSGEQVSYIEEQEIQLLSKLMDNKDNAINFSIIHKENDKIKILNGPLVGMEGRIISINTRKGRAKVRLDFLNEEKIVELGVEIIQSKIE